MPTKNIEVQGLQETISKFKDMQGKAEKAVADGTEEWARAICLSAADGMCPVKSGTMRNTHQVVRTEKEVTISYGGPAAPYTLKQHEDASLHHTVGEDHWLEKAANQTSKELKPIIERRIGAITK